MLPFFGEVENLCGSFTPNDAVKPSPASPSSLLWCVSQVPSYEPANSHETLSETYSPDFGSIQGHTLIFIRKLILFRIPALWVSFCLGKLPKRMWVEAVFYASFPNQYTIKHAEVPLPAPRSLPASQPGVLDLPSCLCLQSGLPWCPQLEDKAVSLQRAANEPLITERN